MPTLLLVYPAWDQSSSAMTDASTPPVPRLVGDRLYGISLRPQELALFGESVRFDLRYTPVVDDLEQPLTEHFKLLVLELSCELPADAEIKTANGRLELGRCGWELELATDRPWPTASLPAVEGELRHLLDRVADTINELARRAGLEVPMGSEVVDRLVDHYGQV